MGAPSRVHMLDPIDDIHDAILPLAAVDSIEDCLRTIAIVIVCQHHGGTYLDLSTRSSGAAAMVCDAFQYKASASSIGGIVIAYHRCDGRNRAPRARTRERRSRL